MRFAKKLREVVANNFLEIARPEEPTPPVRTPSPAFDEYEAPVSPPPWTRAPEVPTPEEVEPEAEGEVLTEEAQTETQSEDQSVEAVTAVEEKETQSETGEPSAPAAPMPTLQSGRDLLPFVSESGVPDVSLLLQMAALPPIPFGAEKAAQIVAALPSDLPMRVKRVTVKTTLEAVNRNIDANDIVTDAVLKKMVLAHSRDAVGEHLGILQQDAENEVARLQAEIVRLKAFTEQTERRRRATEKALNETIEQMEQVVFFFQPEEEVVAAPASEDELPPFMRSDNAARLLRLNETRREAGSDSEVPVEAAGPASERRGRARRRIPVAETVEAATETTARDENA